MNEKIGGKVSDSQVHEELGIAKVVVVVEIAADETCWQWETRCCCYCRSLANLIVETQPMYISVSFGKLAYWRE